VGTRSEQVAERLVLAGLSVTVRSAHPDHTERKTPAMPFAQLTASGIKSPCPAASSSRTNPRCARGRIALVEHQEDSCRSHRSRASLRNAGVAGFTPISPWIGSSRMATVSGSCTASATRGRHCKGTWQKPCHGRLKAFLHLFLARRRDAREGAAMEGAEHVMILVRFWARRSIRPPNASGRATSRVAKFPRQFVERFHCSLHCAEEDLAPRRSGCTGQAHQSFPPVQRCGRGSKIGGLHQGPSAAASRR